MPKYTEEELLCVLSRPLKPVQSSLEVAGAEGTQGVERRESVHRKGCVFQVCTFFLCKG